MIIKFKLLNVIGIHNFFILSVEIEKIETRRASNTVRLFFNNTNDANTFINLCDNLGLINDIDIVNSSVIDFKQLSTLCNCRINSSINITN